MLIDVSQVKRAPGKTQEFQLIENLEGSLNWQGEEFVLTKPITLRGTVEGYEGGTILVRGELKTQAKVQCSRCLKPVQYPIEADLEGEFSPEGRSLPDGREEEFPGQFYFGDSLQLEGLVRESIYLSLPMQFLCSDECQGLCPQCGIRFEAGRCDCEQEHVDPRFEVLKQLLKEKNRKGGF